MANLTLLFQKILAEKYFFLVYSFNLCHLVFMNTGTSPYERQIAPRFLPGTNELCLSSLLNFFAPNCWSIGEYPRSHLNLVDLRNNTFTEEKFKNREGQKPRNPLKNQGFFLIVPIISLSPRLLRKQICVFTYFSSNFITTCHIFCFICLHSVAKNCRYLSIGVGKIQMTILGYFLRFQIS